MAAPLIELTTLIEQPTIKIDGNLYPILHPEQLGVIDFQRLAFMGAKVAELLKKDEPDDADAAELNMIIGDLTDRIMVSVPAEVRNKLSETQRIAVAEVFMTLPRDQTRAKKKQTPIAKDPNRSAGSKLRSGASGSTAGARSDG